MKKYRTVRFIFGVALLPVCIAATLTLLEAVNMITRSSSTFSRESIALAAGYVVWLAIWFLLPRPARTYVLAHELTHAICGLIFGADVKKLNVTENGGSVTLSKSNLWITLSPYFFPFYTVIVILAWGITAYFVKPVPWLPLWYFMIGLTWSFHACFTLASLSIRQPDIQIYGRIFSYAIIYFLNLIVIAVWLIGTTPIKASTLCGSFRDHTCSIYGLVYEKCTYAVRRGVRKLR